jgi:polyisoprenoid-binding protein YceI
MPKHGAEPRRRIRGWVIGAAIVVVLLAVAAPFVYIHFIEGSAPPKLTLPGNGQNAGTGHGSSPGGSPSGSTAGTWHVGAGSVVGYRVEEVLIGQHSTAVGRGSRVSGSITISGTTVTSGTFAVAMASVVSDQSQRNAQFDGHIMDVARYPTSTLRISEPIVLGTVPAVGATATYPARADLTMHGVTKSVSFTVSAERTGAGIAVLADIPIQFSEWNISNPSIGGFVTTADHGTLEALLHLTLGAGNAPVTNGSGPGAGGPQGGPITVPSTTVPPLTIPTSG